ncbi:MAG: hypothetical protein ACI9TH_000945 [Kiritimatiellia bacterium]|jgi:hypothetical protein
MMEAARNFIWHIFGCTRKVQSDESGNLLVLTGIMTFVFMVFAFSTLFTAEAIYNRIMIQNAVDSAADSAVLWQARGLNLIQHLNNFHYILLWLYAALTIVGCCCKLAQILCAASLGICVPCCAIGGACGPASKLCDVMPDVQEVTTTVIHATQGVIAGVTPILAFIYANENAKFSGATEIDNQLTKDFSEDFKIGLKTQLGSTAGGIGGTFASAASKLALFFGDSYAVPLNPLSLSLGVSKELIDEGDPFSNLPWILPIWMACFLAEWEVEHYSGRPGYLTWVAFRERPTRVHGPAWEWLNPEDKTFVEDPALTDGTTDFMSPRANMHNFTNRKGDPFMTYIPAYMAMASAQVDFDGKNDPDGVIDYNLGFEPWKALGLPGLDGKSGFPSDGAYGSLIPVKIPLINTRGTMFGILH